MTTIEKIRAEIERRQKENYKQAGSFAAGRVVEDADILSFLSTLESGKGLDVTEFCKPIEPGIAKCIADHWFEMLGEEDSEKPMNQDELEKAVVDYFEGYWPGMETAEQCNTDLHFTPPAIMRLARHFAKWGAERQKEQDDRLVDIIYQQGIEKGKDEIRKTLKRKEKK